MSQITDRQMSTAVERASNAGPRNALRASPGAHQQKDQTFMISDPEKDDYRRTPE
jgi:hypothetical protein